MIQLIITLPDGSLVPTLPQELLEHRITIGSGVACTLVVPHDSVAEEHVELLLDSNGYLVADLVGAGATKINGHPIEPGVHYQLETGTKIQMGEVEAVYIAADMLQNAAVDAGEVQEPESEPAGPPASGVFVPAMLAVASADLPPGGYPLPAHPPGMFVPKKAARSLWVMASVAVTFVAVAAAIVAGYLSSTVSIQH